MSAAVLQYILIALQALPGLVQAGASLATEVEQLMAQLQIFQQQKRDPTADEWAAQAANLVQALAALHKASQ